MPQSVPINPEKWLTHARELAEHQQGSGRPKLTVLRRAVSTAYYGLFHSLTLTVVADLLPDGTADQRHELARTFGHRDIKQCCAWIAGRQGGVPRPVRLLVDQLKQTPFLAISDAFCDLQEARHRADYDHLESLSKPTVVGYVDDAEKASRDLSTVADVDRHAFAAMVAVRARPNIR